ncbi:D-alanyl-D-alanine carboxypeptidase [Streptomyces achromogenes]|uniref:D-alanyl-D-alanine carboxypeptidase n=1 Tax=Streptomyces achromogenes TaxID=67255 RepID=UPI0036F9C85F
MAGESPDRSKQRESSAEPTSQSAGSVPETRDPRLTVAREKDSSARGTDTATKVLTVRPDTPAEPGTPAGSEEASGAEGSVPADGDTELRAAVSAWIREPGSDATAKGAGAAGDEDEGSSKETVTGGGSSGGEAEVEGEGDGDESSDSRADARSEGPSDTGAADGDGDGDDDGDGTDAGAKADADEHADAKADADGKADTDGKDEADGKGDAASGADGDSGADAKDEPEAETDADAKGTADAKEEADAKSGTDATPDTKAGIDADADAKNDTGAKADADTAGGTGTDSDAKKDAAPGAKPGTKAGASAAGVDQPTTVFKAVQPKKPAVDQPTTMLKVGDTAKPKPKPADAEPVESAESESERTSKFVALKDDMRRAGKAPAPKDGTPQADKAGKAPVSDATTAVPRIGPERTTQQPLPPKPPLDLLAELTNTPPPPETPVRTLVRRIKIWTPLVLLLAIIFAVVQTFRPLPAPALALTAEDTYTFDGGATRLPWPGEGQGWVDVDGIGTMGNFGEQKPAAIGSVAKTMTAYIILRDHPLKPGQEGPKIKIDEKAEKEAGYNTAGESTLTTVKAGQYLTEKQALSAVMIPSANNIARLLARWDAGSEAAFVKKMNATAKELGMTGTTYTDPSGLKETTVSTAHDQVKLGRAVVKVPALVAITSVASWTDPSGHFWPNTNELPYRIGAIGIKTGSTTAAGGNLLFADRKKVGGQTVTIVGAILGQHKPDILDTANKVSKTALLAAREDLTSTKVLKKGDVVGYVDDRLGGHTPVAVTEDVTAVGWAGLKVELTFASGTVPHTAKAGTRVGTLTVGDGTAAAVKVPVALQKDLAEPGFGAKLTRLG